MRHLTGALATLATVLATASPAPAAAATPRVLVAVLAPQPASEPVAAMLETFAAEPGLHAIGLLNMSVGDYNEQQALLDITQSARVPRLDYSPQAPPELTVSAGGTVEAWSVVLRRARSADADLEPGLLASLLRHGGAYASGGRTPGSDAVIAADRQGRVAQLSLGSARSLVGRVDALLRAHALVVVDLPRGALGARQLGELLATRPPSELLIALERPPATSPRATTPPTLLALAVAGLGSRPAALTSATTRTNGLVTTLDLAPTILRWLTLRVPPAVVGAPISAAAPRSPGALAAFAQRLSVIAGRRTPVIVAFLATWLALWLAALASRRPARWALRSGGLAALWLPSTALLAAALRPTQAVEILIVVAVAFALAIACDQLAGWPRAPALPAAAMLVLYTVDLARGSPLIETSLLGSNPISGARFFGAGNELAAAFPIILFAGLAAGLPQRIATRRDALLFAGAGALLTLIVAWGRLGANAGAIFTIGGGTAIGTVLLAPGKLTWRRLACAAAATLAGVAVLAGLDLATGGGAHFTRQVLHAQSSSALFDTLWRRLSEAYATLVGGEAWVAVLVCLAIAAALFADRARVLRPVAGSNVWRACLGGGFAGSLLGSVANDSGTRLLFVGCFLLACVLAYVRGDPALAGSPGGRPVPFLPNASRRKRD
ncbi:MAG: hypothetical protein ABSG64_08515 [Solirubrobacteraceae bacterium]